MTHSECVCLCVAKETEMKVKSKPTVAMLDKSTVCVCVYYEWEWEFECKCCNNEIARPELAFGKSKTKCYNFSLDYMYMYGGGHILPPVKRQLAKYNGHAHAVYSEHGYTGQVHTK